MAAYEIIRAYASPAGKVLPIASSVTRKTGRLRTKEDVSGKRETRVESRRCFFNQVSDGPYARAKTRAEDISEIVFESFRIEVPRPATRLKPQNRVKRPINQEPTDINTSFIRFVSAPGSGQSRSITQIAISRRRNLCNLNNGYCFCFRIPWPRRCSSSNAFGMPSNIAGLMPNGPPSLLEANSM